MKFFLFSLVVSCIYLSSIYSQTETVTNSSDSGVGSLRQAITNINGGSDASNTINMQVPGNSPISVGSDLPVIKKNTVINSTGQQPINGQGQYRLFATIMADLSLTSCVLRNGAAIGGNGGGGGMGAGGGVYIDRGNTLILENTVITSCKAQGGIGKGGFSGGGGASFCESNKNGTKLSGGGDFPGKQDGTGGSYDGSPFLKGYGGGTGAGAGESTGGGNGAGKDGTKDISGTGGYCGGSGGQSRRGGAGGGGNGGGNGYLSSPDLETGGGGFGSGGGSPAGSQGNAGGGGFGGGGGGAFLKGFCGGGGGFGGGGGGGFFIGRSFATGGRFGGDCSIMGRTETSNGGGAGIGGAIFVGDTATCIIQDNVSISNNQAIGGATSGTAGFPGEGYAPDIFLFREAKVIFNNQQPLNAPYSIMADQEAPAGHLDNGIVKQGPGQLTLSNTNNNYRGGTSIEGGTLSVTDPKALGSQTAPITLDGGTLQPTETMTITNPIAVNGTGGIDTPAGTTLTTTGNISGSGTINKTNAGTWQQTGTSTHTGDLNVNGGTLQVDGTLPSNINVNPGGTLRGTGIAGGNVTNSGTVAPGGDNIGTLTIGGNYTQNPDGLLKLQMKPGGQSDKLNVRGTAELNGALDLDLEPGIYQKNQNYNLIHSDGGISGFFNQVSTNSRVTGVFGITPNDFNVLFDNPQIILPIPTDQLPNNQKNLSNYLFCDNFPFENDNLVNLLQNLFQLSVPDYIKALTTLTPEHYGALPIGESRCVEYLLTQNPPTCASDCPTTDHTITLLPLYYRNDIHRKHYHLPNYEQNTGGIRLQYSYLHPTNITTEIAGSYLHTHTKWSDQRGTADSNGAYLDTKLVYRKNNFYCSLGLLGAYSYVSTYHTLFIGYPIKAHANPHYWDVAESLSAEYTTRWNCISFIPRVTLVQTNVFLSSISEDKPKGLNLETESKYFGFLDSLVSIKIQAERQAQCTCVKAYLDLGWHGITHLSNRTFHSKLDNYTACQCSFATQTYKGDINRFFMEWGATISYCPNFDLLMNYRTEFTKGDLVQAVNFGAQWRF